MAFFFYFSDTVTNILCRCYITGLSVNTILSSFVDIFVIFQLWFLLSILYALIVFHALIISVLVCFNMDSILVHKSENILLEVQWPNSHYMYLPNLPASGRMLQIDGF